MRKNNRCFGLALCLSVLALSGCVITEQQSCGDTGSCGNPGQTGENGYCGDGKWDALTEECDGAAIYYGCATLGQGFSGGTLGCKADCTFDTSGCVKESLPVCGNGILENGEECDGELQNPSCTLKGFNSGTIKCSTTCQLDLSGCSNAVCGNGLQEIGEACDHGANNGQNGYCNTDCSGMVSYCGDGIPDEGETCDDGELNGTYGHCNADCTGPGERCGDGIVQENEECDGELDAEDTCEAHEFYGGEISCNSDCTYNFQSCVEPDCTNEAATCDGNYLKVCDGGKWNWTSCSDFGLTCIEGACVEVCANEKETRCQGGKLETCVSGRWVSSECETGYVCTDGECLMPCDDEADSYCSTDGLLMVCQNGFWGASECDQGLTCANGDCLETCGAGDTSRCSDEDDDVLEICTDGFWTPFSCGDNYICDNAVCVEVCTDESPSVCTTDGLLKSCANGKFFTTESCGDQKYCENGKCIDNCSSNDLPSCNSDGTRRFCNESDHWENEACEAGKGCVDGFCVETCTAESPITCTPDGKVNMCVSGKWEAVSCITGLTCVNGECIEVCTLNGDTRCTGQGQIETCTDGLWVRSDCGSNEFCIGKECVKTCDPAVDKPLCTNDGLLKKCVEQTWTTVKCSDYVADQICVDGQCVYECEDVPPYCVGSVAVTCENHRVVRADCGASGLICDNGSCVKDDPTTCSISVCSGGQLTVCKNGVKQDPVSCDNGCNEQGTECATGIYCNFQALVQNTTDNFNDATGYGRVTKDITLAGGGLYCTTDLSKPITTWTYGAIPTLNTAYSDSGVNEWIGTGVYNNKTVLSSGKNYCIFMATYKDENNVRQRFICMPNNHDETKTLPEALPYSENLYLAESQTRTIDNLCGNGNIDSGEECDGENLNGKTCADVVDNSTGTLTCKAGCFFNRSNCKTAGLDNWDYTEDFSGATASVSSYSSTATYTNGDVTVDIKARLDKYDYIVENDQAVILGKKDDGNYISVTNITRGIGRIKFAYKASNTANGLKVMIGDEEYSVKPQSKDVEYFEKIIDSNATSIKIEPDSSNRRVVVDDLQWTNK